MIKRIPARKTILILDTCASGRLIERLTEKRQISSSQGRALKRIKERTGFHILAGSAADRVSYETSRYAQGLLTYSLLFGMRGAALRKDGEGEFVDVLPLFEYAADQVPKLAKGIGGIQRPVMASPTGGGSFDIGQITSEDKEKIPLQTERPLVLRANFQDERKVRDHLRLSKMVNEQLREASYHDQDGGEAQLVFVDAEEFPDGIELFGRYRFVGESVSVTVILAEGEKELAKLEVVGNRARLDQLARDIVRQATMQLSHRH